VALVEWGDAAEPVLGQDALAVELASGAVELAGGAVELASGAVELAGGDTDDHRVITLRPSGERWLARWEALSDALAGWRVGS
jgi:X-X-X-Leu-X-X-Gly heptad repeat protein